MKKCIYLFLFILLSCDDDGRKIPTKPFLVIDKTCPDVLVCRYEIVDKNGNTFIFDEPQFTKEYHVGDSIK